jgi:V8-like Glu-specific endopeptidase
MIKILLLTAVIVANIANGQVKSIDYSERLINSTVRIESSFTGDVIGTGTGFFFDFQIDIATKSFIHVIVTNKHVVKNAKKIKLFLKEKDSLGGPDYTKTYELELNNPTLFIVDHPDTTIDLCVIPVALLNDSLKKIHRTLYYDIFAQTAIPSQDINNKMLAIEEVYMVGYPNGLWDKVHNLPIVRRGITATAPTIDYNAKKEFVVDIAAFPGSSGSPVFLYNPNFYQTKKAIETGGRIYLLGILYAGPLISMKGQVILKPINQTTYTDIPMNLGYVLKSDLLLGILPPLKVLHYKLGGK